MINWKQILGGVLLLIPLTILFGLMIDVRGFMIVLKATAISVGLTACIYGGIWLLFSEY